MFITRLEELVATLTLGEDTISLTGFGNWGLKGGEKRLTPQQELNSATELKVTTDANVSKFNLAIELQKEIERFQYLMADSITTQMISDTAGVKYVVKRTNHSDGTGETDSVLVDPSYIKFYDC